MVAVAILTAFADALIAALEPSTVAFTVFFQALASFAAAAAHSLGRAPWRRDGLVVNHQRGALESLLAVQADGTHCHHALAFVGAVIPTIATHTVGCAPHVVSETRAVLLQTLGPSATAPLLATTLLTRVLRPEPAEAVHRDGRMGHGGAR